MRRRRSRRSGGVRPSAAFARSGADRPRQRGLVGACRRWGGRRGSADEARGPVRVLHGARGRRARPSCGEVARAARARRPRPAFRPDETGLHPRRGQRRAHDHRARREAPAHAARFRSTATTRSSSSRVTLRRSGRPARHGSSPPRPASCQPCARVESGSISWSEAEPTPASATTGVWTSISSCAPRACGAAR